MFTVRTPIRKRYCEHSPGLFITQGSGSLTVYLAILVFTYIFISISKGGEQHLVRGPWGEPCAFKWSRLSSVTPIKKLNRIKR